MPTGILTLQVSISCLNDTNLLFLKIYYYYFTNLEHNFTLANPPKTTYKRAHVVRQEVALGWLLPVGSTPAEEVAGRILVQGTE